MATRTPHRPCRLAGLSALASLGLIAHAAAGFTPVVSVADPRGGQRGTEVALHFYGERLDEIQEILQDNAGLEIRGFEVKDHKTAIARIFIRPDAPLGEHGLRVRTAGGVSYLRSFFVGAMPTVAEADPNDRFDQAQKVDLNVTVQGVVKAEDVDYYVCSMKKGQRLSVEVEAMRLGRTFFDAYVAILDPKSFELASCDDTPLLRNDAYASVIVPEDGDYRVVVREAAYEGNDACQYRLHIGSFPRPGAIFPTGAKPGETVEFRFIGDPAGEFTQSVAIPADASGLFPVFASRDDQFAPSPNWIQVSPMASANEAEPNPNPAKATPLPEIPCAAHGILQENGDVDFFSFQARKGENLNLRVLGRELRSPVDAVLQVRDAKGKTLANNDDQGGPDPVLNWAAPEDGTYYAVVRDQLRNGGPAFTYRLEIVRRQPAIAASLPVVERNDSQKWKMICVPRGNRYAALVNVSRESIGANLALDALSLPAGVQLHAPTVARSVNAVPIVFEAAADAPIAGSFHEFRLRSTGDAPAVEGRLVDTIHHVEVNNQGPYHTAAPQRRIPVAVIEEAPYRLELDSPAVPIVKNGTLLLKVRALRHEGYKEPIQLRFLWNPPGIGSPATVTLPGDQSEALYELNANGDAAVGEWKVCVLGEANTPKGPVLASTALVPLRIAEPYLTLAMDMAATEQGKPTSVLAKLEYQAAFQGQATAELLGLPHGVKAPPVTFSHGQAEIQFPLEVAADATVGKHTALFCKVTVPENGSTIHHTVGQGGTLRIDKPMAEPAPVAAAEPKPADSPPPEAPAAKPLSRLEQLRQRQKTP